MNHHNIPQHVPFSEKLADHHAILQGFLQTRITRNHSERTFDAEQRFLQGWFGNQYVTDDTHPEGKRHLLVWEAMAPVIGRERIQAFTTYLIKDRKLKVRTVTTYLGILRRIFEYVLEFPYIPGSNGQSIAAKYGPIDQPVLEFDYPAHALDQEDEDFAEPKGLTREQVRALLKAATHSKHAKRDLALLALLLGTGMRMHEVAALTVQDIQRTSTGWCVQCSNLKNGASRWVPLRPPIFQMLLSYLAFLDQTHPILRSLKTPDAGRLFQLPETPRMSLFQSQSGRALSSRAISSIVSKLAMETGFISSAGGIVGRLRLTFIEAYWTHHPDDIHGLFMLLGQRMPRSFCFLHVLVRGKDLRNIPPDKLEFIDTWYSQLIEAEE